MCESEGAQSFKTVFIKNIKRENDREIEKDNLSSSYT